ncbi:hypothetical protein [Chryseobacterium sp. Bi04]|uniref:hypothetical protein n=1 Tax=Chryseobacterium sp. Bi04 TaxID=2822345 RepID=UPI001DCA166B|nr:hypothetical protein [Chryseobacterium sp. Bi04]CAH0256740.1 hypothetical protein SRABI04_03377 [Chryseobacterium sp. Bi04]
MRKNTVSYFIYTLVISLFIFSSCKNRNLNYITYYNKVNEIDSIYRFKKDTLSAIKQYKKLFRKYPPLNQDRIQEYETYIRFADQHHKNFGGKKSLYKLIPLIAPYWQYRKEDTRFIQLYKKYGINRQEIDLEITQWKKRLNRKLIDSFTVAFKRDQDSRKNSLDIIKNDKKNAEMLKWMFENEGFPGLQKIGITNGDFFMPSGPLLLHMADYDEYHPYFKTKILEYVKSGECPPRDYAAMIDRYYLHILKKDPPYWVYIGNGNLKDSAVINRNRKSVGLPGLRHAQLITKDFSKKNKTEK